MILLDFGELQWFSIRPGPLLWTPHEPCKIKGENLHSVLTKKHHTEYTPRLLTDPERLPSSKLPYPLHISL